MKQKCISEEQLKTLLNEGLTTKEIAKILECGLSKIKVYKNKFGLSKAPVKSVDSERIKELYNKGLRDPEIAKELNIHQCTVARHRQMLMLPARYKVYTDFPLDKFAYSALVGSILGDATLTIGKGKNAYLNYAHSINQQEYFFHKQELWKSILRGWKMYVKKDPRTAKLYSKYSTFSETHPELTKLYNLFYPHGKKIITEESVKLLDIVGIAYLFMDDGSHGTSGGGIISVNGFDKTSTNILSTHIYNTLGILSKRYPDGSLYFRKAEFKKLCDLIKPYIISSMIYKLHLGPH